MRRHWGMALAMLCVGFLTGCDSDDEFNPGGFSTVPIVAETTTQNPTAPGPSAPPPNNPGSPSLPGTPVVPELPQTGRPTERGIVLINTDEYSNPSGRSDNLYHSQAFMSANGRYVFFSTNALNIVSQAVPDPVFPVGASGHFARYDLETGESVAIPLTTRGSNRTGDYLVDSNFFVYDTTADGRYVLVSTVRSPLEGDTSTPDNENAIYRIDVLTGDLVTVSTDPAGTFLPGSGRGYFLGSSDHILLNFYPGDVPRIAVRDLSLNTLEEVARGSIQFAGQCLSADKTKFVFEGADGQLYYHDLQTSLELLLSERPNGDPSPQNAG